ncbi:MAG: hypothetical protein WCF65_03070 [Parachlamydiaceae bacterium]
MSLPHVKINLCHRPIGILVCLRCLICSTVLLFVMVACTTNRQPSYVNPVLTSINIVDRNVLTETINNPERLSLYSNVNFFQPQPYQKVLRIYSRDAQGNIPARITSYHSNGYPNKYLEVVNSRACGQYKEWFSNGNKKIEANIIEGSADIVDGSEKTWVFNGCCQAWNECGEPEATIPYVKGCLEGVATYYHPNGTVWKIVPYCDNHIEGVLEVYRSDGVLLQKTFYCNGLKERDSTRYWEADQLAAEEIYCEGLLSFGRYYDCTGACIAKVDEGVGIRAIFSKDAVIELQEYLNGQLEGEVRILDRFGRVSSLYHAKNQCKQGEEIIYYDAPRFKQTLLPKLSINWYEGKIQGITKTWYDNGVQESQREMSNNKRNGHSSAWFRDGSLMLIEEYDQDKLTKGEYYSKGEKHPISTINEGKGSATLFDAEGSFVRKVDYLNGKPVLEE